MFYSNDPSLDLMRYTSAQERELRRLPKCSCCDERIQQETAVCINDEYYCDGCLLDLRESIGDD